MAEDYEHESARCRDRIQEASSDYYVKGLHNSAELRKKLHAVDSFAEVEGIFRDYLQGELVAA